MRLLDYKTIDMLNGDGVRASLWFSGCDHKCVGCFAADTWNYNNKKSFPFTEDILELIDADMNDTRINRAGLSLLGGDPLYKENVFGVIELLKWFKENHPNKTVWVWTGYTREQIEQSDFKEVLDYIDVLIDGRFEQDKRDLSLKFRGSSNQRVIYLKQE
ncbi:MAG: anaerobic ribonucleoside-triphosphate reductase activating protein [Culicoidibacterales bacterium]